MNTKNNLQEGISGVYPDLPFWKEFAGVVTTALFFILPVVFAKLRMSLNDSMLKKYTVETLKRVKADRSSDSLRVKIARAIQGMMHNPNTTEAEPTNYEQLVLNLLPKDFEKKDDEEVKTHITDARQRLGLSPIKARRI
jgi:hypothetical protein